MKERRETRPVLSGRMRACTSAMAAFWLPIALCARMLLVSAAQPATLSAKAWFSSTSHPSPFFWPEKSDPRLRARPNVGIAISGGGSRSYLCALGYLRGMEDLGLMEKARYISGVSGSSLSSAWKARRQVRLLGDIISRDSQLLRLSQLNDPRREYHSRLLHSPDRQFFPS